MQMLKPCAWCIGAFMIPNTSKKCVAVLGKTSVQAHVNASFFVSFCLNTLVYSFVRKRHMEKAREGEETQGRNEGFQALRGRGRRLPIGSAWWFIRWGWHSTSEEEVSPTQEAPLRHPFLGDQAIAKSFLLPIHIHPHVCLNSFTFFWLSVVKGVDVFSDV